MTHRGQDARRVVTVVSAACFLGLLSNALSGRPVPILAADGPGALPERSERISAEALRAEVERGRAVAIVDVRGEESFHAGHAAGAFHAAANRFLDRYASLGLPAVLKAAQLTVVVCEGESCPSGDRVAKLLKELGHANIRVLHGGWGAYEKSGLAVARG